VLGAQAADQMAEHDAQLSGERSAVDASWHARNIATVIVAVPELSGAIPTTKGSQA
jgi:hypothetical protein